MFKSKKKNKINNLLIRKLSFLINKNRYQRRSKLNAVPYCYKSKPQRYGPGKNICIINNLTSIPASGDLRISLQDALLGNAEFSTKKMFYRYFKLLEVRMVFFPNGTQSNNFHFINLTWNDVQYTASDLIKDDTSKIVSVYRTKMKVIRWKPIRGVINVNSVSQTIPTNFLDVSQFISTDRVVSFPGWLMIGSAGNDDKVSLEIIVEFRGNDYGDVAKKFEDYIKSNKKNNQFIEEEFKENKINKIKDNDEINNLDYEDIDENSNKTIEENNNKKEVQIYGDIEDSNNLKLLSDHTKPNKQNSEFIKLTYSRLKDINSLEPHNKKDVQYNLNKEEDEFFQDNEDTIFPLKFYDINKQERLSRKDETINKLNKEKPIFKETGIKENTVEKPEIRKRNMSKSKKQLLDETTFKTILPQKDSGIT